MSIAPELGFRNAGDSLRGGHMELFLNVIMKSNDRNPMVEQESQ